MYKCELYNFPGRYARLAYVNRISFYNRCGSKHYPFLGFCAFLHVSGSLSSPAYAYPSLTTICGIKDGFVGTLKRRHLEHLPGCAGRRFSHSHLPQTGSKAHWRSCAPIPIFGRLDPRDGGLDRMWHTPPSMAAPAWAAHYVCSARITACSRPYTGRRKERLATWKSCT